MTVTDDPIDKNAKRLTAKQWAEIVGLWESGGVRGKDLAEQYGVTPESISRGLKKRGAVYGKHAAAAAKKVIAAATDDTEVSALRAKETREDHYKYAVFLARLATKKIQDAEADLKLPPHQRKHVYGSIESELKSIQAAMKINQTARQERWTVLGLDRDDAMLDDMPELTIREMSDEEIHTVRQRQEEALRELGTFARVEEDDELRLDEEL